MNSLEQAEGRVCRPPSPEADGVARAACRGPGAHGRGGVPPSSRSGAGGGGVGGLLIDEPLRVVECGFMFFLSDNPTSRNPNLFLGFR